MTRTPWAALLLATTRISAHHAFAAEYDENKRVTVSGTVASFEWTNPHAWLRVDGKDENDKIGRWSFEMGSPGGLLRRGWERGELKKGDQVTVAGYRAKNGANVANAAPSLCRMAGSYSEASKPLPVRPQGSRACRASQPGSSTFPGGRSAA